MATGGKFSRPSQGGVSEQTASTVGGQSTIGSEASQGAVNDVMRWQLEESVSPAAIDLKEKELVRQGLISEGESRDELAGNQVSARHYNNYSLVVTNGVIFVIRDAIQTCWLALGGTSWGRPTTDDIATPDGFGRQAMFTLIGEGLGGVRNSAIVFSERTGRAYPITGILFDRFIAAGGLSALGYPMEGTGTILPDNSGFIAEFQRIHSDEARAAIVFKHGDTRAVLLHGAIYAYWRALKGAASPAKLPRFDEQDNGGLGRRMQVFEGGTIYWRDDPQVGAYFGLDTYQVWLRGFRVGRSAPDDALGLDPSLEFYFGVSAVPRFRPATESRSTKLPTNSAEYEKLRRGRWRHDNVLLYEGSSDALSLTFTGAERDLGDPDKYKTVIEEGTKKSVGAAVEALATVIGGPVGALGAKAGEPLTNLVSKALSDEINKLMGTGDDLLDTTTVLINLPTLLQYLNSPPTYAEARNADGTVASPIHHHFSVDLVGNRRHVELFIQVSRVWK